MTDKTPAALGTADIRWDLTRFYASADDAALDTDVAALVAGAKAFEVGFKGKLDVRLGDALRAYGDLYRLHVKLSAYFDLVLARDSGNAAARKQASRVQEALTVAWGNHTTFFELELGRMAESALQALQSDAVVAKHMPWIAHVRAMAKHQLSEDVERVLTLRSPYGPSEWSDMMSELEGELTFEFDGKRCNLPELLHRVADDRDAALRARAMQVLNEGLAAQKLTYFMARTLNVTAGGHLANYDLRGFTHPMQATNLSNMVDDATVVTLHEVVEQAAAPLAKRFYRLKAKLLGMETLAWSDRNAPMPFAPATVFDWPQSCRLVLDAYRAFSPTLGGLVETVLDPRNGWVDAPPAEGKTSGAFDYTVVLPDSVRSYMLLNHLGSAGDVMTLAHELGHAVHGMLAAEAQGPLMWHAPMPYAETASIFGEMLTFESLLGKLTDPRDKLALYMSKINDFFNTVVRQICFSEFEQGFYAQRRSGKLTVEDFTGLWTDVTHRFYGPEGEVFTYANMDNMWAYISHFYAYQPFYVYAYAFGELFTQSLMATRGRLGDQFEPLYLDLLKAGGTKDAVALMAPFGLNPNDRMFWEEGIANSVGVWLAEAEKLVAEIDF